MSRVLSTIVCADVYPNGFTLCISTGEDVYSFGEDNSGALGHSTDHHVPIPRMILGLHNIKAIACGFMHTICLDYSENVFGFGSNLFGQLGIESEPCIREPVPISLPAIKQISCGSHFTICVSEDRELYSFGANTSGQIGIGEERDINFNSPQKIESLENVDFVECGSGHVICRLLTGDVFSWGYNGKGQLGIGNMDMQFSPCKCVDWPDNIVDIKCGSSFALVLTSNLEVYSVGSNQYGQLGRSTFDDFSCNLECIASLSNKNIVRIECGSSHSMCIDSSKQLYVFGANFFGQLGLDDFEDRYKITIHPTLSNIIDISKGGIHTFVKTSDNQIYAFGRNHLTQLGTTTKIENQLSPIQVFQENVDIWNTSIVNSRAKSARK